MTAVETTPTNPTDACPHRRPFAAGFAGCPAFQAVTYLSTDSFNNPLPPVTTCRHLQMGQATAEGGRYYAQCALGDGAGRLAWLAQLGARRLQLQRELQAELDGFTLSRRRALIEVRGAARAGGPDARRRLEGLIAEFLKELRAFVEARWSRYEDAGLEPAPLLKLVEEWLRTWASSRPLPGTDAIGDPIPAFVGGPAPGQHGEVVGLYQGGTLQVARLRRPPGLTVSGELDATNWALLAEALAAMPRSEDLHVDLGDLSFCSLDGMRALVRTAEDLAEGCRLHVHRVPSYLERALQLTGWGDLPNLVRPTEPLVEVAQ